MQADSPKLLHLLHSFCCIFAYLGEKTGHSFYSLIDDITGDFTIESQYVLPSLHST